MILIACLGDINCLLRSHISPRAWPGTQSKIGGGGVSLALLPIFLGQLGEEMAKTLEILARILSRISDIA